MEFILKLFVFCVMEFEGCYGTPTTPSSAQLPESATFLKRLSDEVELKLRKFDRLAEKMESISRTVIANNATLRQEQIFIEEEQESLRVVQSKMRKDYREEYDSLREEQSQLREEQSNLLAEQEKFQELFSFEQTKTSSKIREMEEKQEKSINEIMMNAEIAQREQESRSNTLNETISNRLDETISKLQNEIAQLKSEQMSAQAYTNSELDPLKTYIAAVRRFPTTLADLFTLNSTHPLISQNPAILLFSRPHYQEPVEKIDFTDCYSSNDCCKPIVKLLPMSLKGSGCFVLHHDKNCKLEGMKSKAFAFVPGSHGNIGELGGHNNKFQSASTCRHTVFN